MIFFVIAIFKQKLNKHSFYKIRYIPITYIFTRYIKYIFELYYHIGTDYKPYVVLGPSNALLTFMGVVK